MNNSEEPIYPVLEQIPFLQNETTLGLTKREHFALELMKATIIGIYSNAEINTHHGWSQEAFANEGIYLADELLKQLQK